MAARLGRARPASAYLIHSKTFTPNVPGDFALQLNSVTMDFAGTPTPPSGDIAMQLNSVTEAFAGTAAEAGDITMQLSSVTADFAGAIINGSFALQLSSVTAAFAGSVNPIGGFAMQLSGVSMSFGSETVPFGAHVIHVEAEKRGLRVNADDTITPIYASEVTDA